MGDRTYAEITINKYYYEQHKEEIEKIGYHDEIREDCEDEATLVCYEANYGHMEPVEDFLKENHIEYDLRWESGGDYGAGNQYARIVNGEYKIHDIYDDGSAVLDELKNILNEKDPTKREALLKKRIKDLEPFEITPLKAPNSIDFIKSDE